MPVLDTCTCKFEETPITTDPAIALTTFSLVFGAFFIASSPRSSVGYWPTD